jgi:hypothetical protein
MKLELQEWLKRINETEKKELADALKLVGGAGPKAVGEMVMRLKKKYDRPEDSPELAAFKADYDWQAAFHEAVTGSYESFYDGLPDGHAIHNVTKVHHSIEGENDGENWTAIVDWAGPEGAVATVDAGCDYTGWD